MNSTLAYAWAGYLSLAAFLISYVLVIFEEKLGLRKSKPVILAGCIMWMFIGLYEAAHGGVRAADEVKRLSGEIAEIFFFVLAAMIYINSLEERLVFDSIKSWLIRKKFSYRALFWATGIITFFLSPVATSLPSALLMATIVNSVSRNRRFLLSSFISIVVAANAGGVWSPFGDITTLMVWAAGKVGMLQFLALVVPSLVNWLIPAVLLFLFVPAGKPEGDGERVMTKPGAWVIIILGILTIAASVASYQFMGLPPFIGMMTGLGLLMFLGSYLKRVERRNRVTTEEQFDIYRQIVKVEFDTLLFFFGVIMGVGAFQYIGYLALLSTGLYGGVGYTKANIFIGVISAFIDNVPVMYAVLKMDPKMDIAQWLLVTFTTGTGGSLLSIGSAAGVAVMAVRKDLYTFMEHLKWLPVIAAGYIASVGSWLLIARWFF